MTKISFITVAIFLSVCLTNVCFADDDPAGYAPAGYQLTFDDEFSGIAIANGTSYVETGTSLDMDLWSYRNVGGSNTESAFSVSNGELVITTYTSGTTNYSGEIGTENSFLQAYGYYEVRMSVTTSPGTLSAFWLQSPTIGTPYGDSAIAGTEIDAVEDRNVGEDNAIHWDGYNGNSEGSMVQNYSADPSTAFITYGVLWTPTGYTFYKNGVETWSTNAAVSQIAEYIILSSGVEDSPGFTGIPPSGGYGSLTSSTTVTLVDYVRAYAPPTPVAVPVDDTFESGTGSWTLFTGSTSASLTTIADPTGTSTNRGSSTNATNGAIGSGNALDVKVGNSYGEVGRTFNNTTLAVGQKMELTFDLRYLTTSGSSSAGFRIGIGYSGESNGLNGTGYIIEVPTGSTGAVSILSAPGTAGYLGNGSGVTLIGSSGSNLGISGTTLHTMELDVTYNGVVNGNNSYTLAYTLDNGTYTFTTTDNSLNLADSFNLLAIGNGDINENFLLDNVYLQVLPPPLTATAGTNTTVSSYSTTLSGLISGTATGETWQLVSGSGTVLFSNSASPTSTITFSAPGTYLLELTANNSQTTASTNSYVTITVNPTPAETWRMNTFGMTNYTNTAIAGDTAAPSGNGVSNLLSYAMNLNPFSNSAVNNLPTTTVSGSNLIFTYQQNDAATDVTYTVEQSTDLQTWTSVSQTPTTVSDDGTTSIMQVTVPMNGQPTLMLHLKVTTND